MLRAFESLVKLEEEHEEAIQTLVENQEDEREAILLVLGRQLLEGRGLHEGDREFGKWCNLNFPNLREHINKDDQAAVIWAAEFPKQHQEMLDKHPVGCKTSVITLSKRKANLIA